MTLEELKAAVTDEWTVRIIDREYTPNGRDDVAVERVTDSGLILRPRQPWGSQGRRFLTTEFTWDGDKEVIGTTVHCYTTGTSITSRSMPGRRDCYKSFVFSPPRGY